MTDMQYETVTHALVGRAGSTAATPFNNALADQFASLITASPANLHAAVIAAQRAMCAILNMDRSSIWQGSVEAPEVLRMTHLCTLDEIPPVPTDITANGAFPWFTGQLLAGQIVAVPDVGALPPEAAGDRASFEHYGDKSTLAIPFPRRPGERAGVVAFAATTRRESWSEPVLTKCQLIVGVLHAVLLRASAEETARELQRQLTHAQKLEAIGRLAAAVAHDFNNLLTVIMATTEEIRLLADRGDRDVRSLVSSLKPIGDAAMKGAALTRRLLTLARPQPRQPRPIDVVEVLAETEPLLQRLLPKNIKLFVSAPARRVFVLAETSQLDQVILNLAVNARDAMRSGGRLDVQIAERDLDRSGAEAFNGLAPGPYVELTVTDTGEGIPPEVLARIFEPFFTTKQPGKGSGLGLATVLSIVREAHGDLTVRSQVGEGTTFCLLLPRTAPPVGEQSTGATSLPAALGETVLVTDDDPAVSRVFARVLRAGGYRVLTAATGEEALSCMQAEDGRVDLVITDVVMSGMSGLELGRSVRARYPKVPILFVTGYSSASADELASVSTLPVLRKPCSIEALARAAHDAITGLRT
jgi:signal transduction histidine kinase/CheY-like chemotaxis protein